MENLITILTILVIELGRQLETTQSLYKELFDLYKKTEKLWKHK